MYTGVGGAVLTLLLGYRSFIYYIRTPIPDPNRRRCPNPIARIQKFYTHSIEGALSAIQSLPEINLNINFKAQNS